MPQRIRRLLGLLLALTLVVGGATQSVQGADMAVKMSAVGAASDMPMSDGCGGCSGGDDGMPMACSAICGSTVSAIIPTAPALAIAGRSAPALAFANIDTGQRGPPDPYPPRPTSLN